MEVKPCNGKKPLMNHLNGKELDCGHGPDRQDCPSGSYCHQTSRFAKCCNKSDRGNTSKFYYTITVYFYLPNAICVCGLFNN